MTLTPEQSKAVSEWVAAGDNLSTIQKKLTEQFKISMTYMDVRFLVDDLNLALKDATPKADVTDVTKAAARPVPTEEKATSGKKSLLEKAKEKLGLSPAEQEQMPEDEYPAEEDLEEALPPDAGPSSVSVTVDKVTLHPGALASGTVTFSDGVTGKWIVDNYGRPGFTEISKPGYRPSAADAQGFMQELSAAIQKRGY